MLLRHGPHSFWCETVSRTRIWVILKSEFIELNDVTMFCVVLPRCVMEFNQISRYSLFVGSFKYSCNASISTGWVYIHHNTFVKTHRYQVNMHLLFLLEVGWWFESLSNFLLSFTLAWMIVYVFLLCEHGARLIHQFEVFDSELGQCPWYMLSTRMQQMYAIFSIETQNPIKVSSYVIVISERETSKKVFSSISRKHWQHFAKTSLKMTKLVIFIFILRLSTQLSHTLWHFAD